MAFKFSLILNVQINFSLKLKAIHIDLKLKVQDNVRIVAILTGKKANNGCYRLWWIMCLSWWFIVTFRSNFWRSLQRCSCLSLKLLYAFENADSSHEERSLFYQWLLQHDEENCRQTLLLAVILFRQMNLSCIYILPNAIQYIPNEFTFIIMAWLHRDKKIRLHVHLTFCYWADKR